MFTKIRGPGHRFKAFYEDNALLIQFILEEFINCYQITLKINNLIEGYLESKETLDWFLLSLIQVSGELVGNSYYYGRSSFSPWTKGPLTKFKEYCEQSSLNSYHQNKHYANLHMAAHQAWLIAIHILELLNSLYIHSSIQNNSQVLSLLPIKRSFNHLQTRLNQISRYIPRVVAGYKDNENVILCLLRKKIFLTEIYGSDFLYRRFKWSITTSELIELLMKRYQARGFEALFPTIQQLFQEEELFQNIN